ncbi:LysR family transcriptional regulator [Rhizorhabdus argentea]|uniref:LysR family transcriptional regulator n=1 Tax=Rhizorhabdus argentea TaxID=1387174 RepID=UPI0030ECDBD2
MLDWDDLRIFLVLARMRKAAPAARALGIDVTTLSRRIARLQTSLNASLFETIGGERRLTERGEALFAHAEEMESATLAAIGDVTGDSSSLSGQVRLSVAEGFATWVLAPALPAFQRDHPDIRLDLVTASGFLNPSKREADMAVMLARPRTGRLVAVKLGNYSLRLYGAVDYLTAMSKPKRIEDLRQHPLVGYVPEFIYSPELDYLSEVGAGLSAVTRSTSINVQHRLIASAAGIGILPAFIGDRDPSLMPLLPELVEIRRSFWLVTHSDLRRLARIEAVARWLKTSVAGMT